jgi:hypothetical protein
MSLVLQSSGGGSVTLQEAVTASNLTITVPAVTGTMATIGPAFSAYLGSTQYPTSGVNTVLQINTEEFDTSSCFDTTNYRFTPNVAGYYQVNGQISTRGTASSTRLYPIIFKNGNIARYGTDIYVSSGNVGYKASIACLIYMNGTTDYLQLGGAVVDSSGPQFTADGELSNYFQAFFVRAA